jgi:hypothetical protein
MRIKNWSKFQHFKDRRPPWVKLYRDILDDIEWHELDPLAAKVLVMLWLIASEDEGRIPDSKTLAFRLRISEVKTKEIIIKLSHWLEHNDIELISSGYQVDLPETETETEREKEKEKEKEKETKKKATVVACPDFVEQQVWDDFLSIRKAKNAPMSETALRAIEREAKKAGWSLNMAISESVSRGWQSFKAEWVKEKLNQSEQRQNTMNQLTRGLSTPKTPFWAKPETSILEAENVEQTRLL